MHPIRAVHDWIVAHPISFEIILTVLVGGSISVFGGDIKQFFLTRPQRLSTWILKARIKALEERKRRLETLLREPSHVVIYTFVSIAFLIFGFCTPILFFVLEIVQDVGLDIHHSHITWLAFMLVGDLFTVMCVAYSSILVRRIQDVMRPERAMNEIERSSKRLSAKLGL